MPSMMKSTETAWKHQRVRACNVKTSLTLHNSKDVAMVPME